MKSESKILNDTTEADLTQTATSRDSTDSDAGGDDALSYAPDAEREHPGLGKQQLIERYQSLIRDGSIYYPVAYRFLKELGRGRQGIVFLGLRHGARGCVTRHAIKVFDPSLYAGAKKYWTDMGRIAVQISRLQSVNTPHLVGRDAYEEANGIGYSQMEAIDGLDLRRMLGSWHLAISRDRSTENEWSRFSDVIFRIADGLIAIQPGVVIHIMRQILRGLEVLHTQGFVHCDIKPSNVMVDRLGNAKIIDYGRAVQVEEKVSMLLGTPYYMAPEIHRREVTRVQSDLYSVGILGLEMLMGERLIDSNEETHLLNFKLELPNRLQDLLPRHVRESETLVRMLRGFVDPDPKNRYANARDADAGTIGLANLHRELVRMEADADYGRELESYLSKLVNPDTKRIER
jgi:serine/threonine protein kinase